MLSGILTDNNKVYLVYWDQFLTRGELSESEDLGRETRDAKCSPVEKFIGFCS